MKTIIVTGGTRGIGRAIVDMLVAKIQQNVPAVAQTRLVVTYRSGMAQADALAAELKDLGIDADIQQMDLADLSSVTAFVQHVTQTCGKADVLINNAGMTNDGSFLAMADADVASLIHTNLSGTIALTEQMVPLLQQAGCSSVIFMASAAGVYGKEGQVPYATTKGGIIGYSQLLARRFGRKRMYINAVAPGFIATDMVTALDPAMFEHTLNNASIGSMGTPADVANVVHSLLTPGYIQATTIKVDGGHLR
ncbi:SDR family NAD(P)-dependent oxidoreductase [Rheinheimera maricola]|uniref:SDR family NAD(P)-dependent oxidoreductase n=1 Tax=Rheinheimera maricola TaxID=2793282 RepID=A0ABS7XC67_9GAMM|nr:SDR family NAD(P)-dependent oxidoreductase [Rheinheimera maricola]MBZ9613149.1 SDR family NAD(P)-dependent oxidoreductase [Rheinheimera maricola]